MGFRVRGKVAPETVKPVPVTVAAFTVTAAVPEEVRVTDWETVLPRATVPKLTLVALNVSPGAEAPRLIP